MKKLIILLLLSGLCSAALSSPSFIYPSEDPLPLYYNPQNKMVRDPSGTLFVMFKAYYPFQNISTFQNYVGYSEDNGANWDFLGADQGAGPLQEVSGFDQESGSLALDGNGVLHAVWSGRDSGQTGAHEEQIKYSRYINGNWSDWINIAEVSGYSGQEMWQTHPMVVSGSNNIIYVTWHGLDINNANSQIKFACSSNGGDTWKTFTNNANKKWINVTGAGAEAWGNGAFSNYPQMRANPLPAHNTLLDLENIYLFWNGGIGGDFLSNTYVVYSTNAGDSWAPYYWVGSHDKNRTNFWTHDVAVGQDGTFHLISSGPSKDITNTDTSGDRNSSSHTVLYINGSDSNSDGVVEFSEWNDWEKVTHTAYKSSHDDSISLTVDQNGNAHVAWQMTKTHLDKNMRFASDSEVYYRMRTNGGGWDNGTQISNGSDYILSFQPHMRWSPYYGNGGYVDMMWMSTTDKNGPYELFYSSDTSYPMSVSGGSNVFLNVFPGSRILELEEGKVTAYPNPADLQVVGAVKFVYNYLYGTAASKRLKIYNFYGHLLYSVKDARKSHLEVPFQWDGTDQEGKPLPDGIYYYSMEVKYDTGRVEKTKLGKLKLSGAK